VYGFVWDPTLKLSQSQRSRTECDVLAGTHPRLVVGLGVLDGMGTRIQCFGIDVADTLCRLYGIQYCSHLLAIVTNTDQDWYSRTHQRYDLVSKSPTQCDSRGILLFILDANTNGNRLVFSYHGSRFAGRFHNVYGYVSQDAITPGEFSLEYGFF